MTEEIICNMFPYKNSFLQINDASQKTLSSYSLTLMCLFYLQSNAISNSFRSFFFFMHTMVISGVVQPPVVPVWQALLPVC